MSATDPVVELQRSVAVWRRMTFASMLVAVLSLGAGVAALSRGEPEQPLVLKVKRLEFVGEGDGVVLGLRDLEGDKGGSSVLTLQRPGDDRGPAVVFSLSTKTGSASVVAQGSDSEGWHQNFAQLVASPESSALVAHSGLTRAQLEALAHQGEQPGLATLSLMTSPRKPDGGPLREKSSSLEVSISGNGASISKDFGGVKSELLGSPR